MKRFGDSGNPPTLSEANKKLKPEEPTNQVNMAESNQQKDANPEFFAPVGAVADQIQATDSSTPESAPQDAQGHAVQEIESLCMNCGKNGTTRLLLTRIPYFREVVIMSFQCPHCGFRNSEIQPAGQIQEKGGKYMLKVESKEDFNRQVVKSESCSVKFAELDIEIPPKKGQLTTVEGLLLQIATDLESDQPVRKHVDEQLYRKIQEVIDKIRETAAGNPDRLPLTVIVDDPAGNSWIEFVPGEPAHKWSHVEYQRTDEQNVALGLLDPNVLAEKQQRELEESTEPVGAVGAVESVESGKPDSKNTRNPPQSKFLSDETEVENLNSEVQTFNATCPTCHYPCPTHMKVVNIPHFKDVIIMSTVCAHCGYKSNEVKTGGAVPEKGRRITLKVDDPEDLARDFLKSETCAVQIPELNLDLNPGTLGGRFTTIEGILKQVHDELESKVFTETSDSMDEATKARWTAFLSNLKEAIAGKKKFTIIMTDPLAASYIQNVYAPDPDPNMTIEDFERTPEQNEDLGLTEMNA